MTDSSRETDDGATCIEKMAMAEMHASSLVFSSLEKFSVYWWRPALAPCRCFQSKMLLAKDNNMHGLSYMRYYSYIRLFSNTNLDM